MGSPYKDCTSCGGYHHAALACVSVSAEDMYSLSVLIRDGDYIMPGNIPAAVYEEFKVWKLLYESERGRILAEIGTSRILGCRVGFNEK